MWLCPSWAMSETKKLFLKEKYESKPQRNYRFSNDILNFSICIFSSFWLVASTLKLNDNQLSTITDIASKSEHKFLLLHKCPKSVAKQSPLGVRCAYGTTKTYDLKTVYAQSQFCLIAKSERFLQLNLIEALVANCIPVIYADNIVLPFSEVVVDILISILNWNSLKIHNFRSSTGH